jgi:hypothetical protein
MSDGDRKTVGAGPVSSVLSYALCPGCSRWTAPPTGFEPASSWRSNAPTRRSPRAVGQPVVRRAMTPVGVLCGRRNAPPRRPHAWGKLTVTASRIHGCPLCQTRENAVRASPPSAPEGNRTPGLQFEKLVSLANGDSGSAVGTKSSTEVWARTGHCSRSKPSSCPCVNVT